MVDFPKILINWRGRQQEIKFSTQAVMPVFEDISTIASPTSRGSAMFSRLNVQEDQKTLLEMAKPEVKECIREKTDKGPNCLEVDFSPLRGRLCQELAYLANSGSKDKLSRVEAILGSVRNIGMESVIQHLCDISCRLGDIAYDYRRVEALTLEPAKALRTDLAYDQFLADADEAITQLQTLRYSSRGGRGL